MESRFKAAALQIAPVVMDIKKTVEKAVSLIHEVAKNGARIVVFPETFIPTYPNWSIDLSRGDEWALHTKEFIKNSLDVPSPESDALAKAARDAGIYVVMGANERDATFRGKIFNSLLFYGPDGALIGRHRKVFPSNREKIFHSMGDGSTLQVFDTEIGKLSGLICYEHLQPLLKYALFAQGEQVHCAAWPGWPDFSKEKPGARSNRHVIDATSRATALEGQVFVIVSSLYIPRSAVPEGMFANAHWGFFGGSGIIEPNGNYIAGPLYDEEGIIYGEIDLDRILVRKAAVDTTGKDSRWDIVSLRMNREPIVPIG